MNENNQNTAAIKIGQELRDARIKADMTIDDVAKKTRIQKTYLVDIEKGDFSDLPGDFYVRAFIQQFADAIGLDGQKMAKKFDASQEAAKNQDEHDAEVNDKQEQGDQETRSHRSAEQKKAAQKRPAKQEPVQPDSPKAVANHPASRSQHHGYSSKGSSFKKFFPIIGTVVLVLIVLAIVWVAGDKIASNHDQSKSSSDISVSQDNSKLAKKNSTPVKKGKTKAEKTIGTKVTLTSPNNYSVRSTKKGASLTVKGVQARTWSSVTLNGTQTWQGTLAQGEKHTVKIPASTTTMEIHSGKAGGTSLAINGSKVPVKNSDPNQVSNLTFKFTK